MKLIAHPESYPLPDLEALDKNQAVADAAEAEIQLLSINTKNYTFTKNLLQKKNLPIILISLMHNVVAFPLNLFLTNYISFQKLI